MDYAVPGKMSQKLNKGQRGTREESISSSFYEDVIALTLENIPAQSDV